ncbi:MAG: Holliday junction branch migration protein RuvA [Myxococcota bacterium]
MIASLRGTVARKDAQGIVIECAGVGYGLTMSLSSLTQLGDVGSSATVLVHTHLTQDSLRLYGFMGDAERRAFEVLIGINGVGPRLAVAVLSFLSPGELRRAVDDADKGALVKVPGVGGKKAERLLVELKGRLLDVDASGEGTAAPSVLDDLASALANLGFPPKDAETTARSVRDAHPDETDLAVLVKAALKR